ncbi:MAG: YdcF family protein [Gammaproteobacteria bacterium]|nr:YdcF family protein [Gammaproteobacteria bacterium]
MDFFIVKILGQLAMPPGPMLILMVTGLLLLRRYQRAGRILLATGFTLLLLFTLPLVSKLLIMNLENTPALSQETLGQSDAKAIIVLGGGSYLNAPEYGEDTVGSATLERIRYGAYLQKKSQLPVLVTGGQVYSWIKTTEADNMKRVMTSQLQVPVKWTETRSRNTWENALYSREVLKENDIKKIILVTHAIHMKRAIMCFEAAGFEVTPAPLGFHSEGGLFTIFNLIPDAGAMSRIKQALHEILGILWYKLRYF